jgi:hypothetical protein
MGIRRIAPTEPIEAIGRQLAWTEARVAAEPSVSGLAVALHPLLGQIAELADAQREAWREEARAAAAIAVADTELDDLVESFSEGLLYIVRGETSDARYQRYFAQAAHRIVRQGLQSQLGIVRGWPGRLLEEQETELQAGSARFAEVIARGEAAIEARVKAASAAAEHRILRWLPFVEDVNAIREGRHALLTERALADRREDDWADRFFEMPDSL